jgi:hypothetical protein
VIDRIRLRRVPNCVGRQRARLRSSSNSLPPSPATSTEMATDLATTPPGQPPNTNACEPHREIIAEAFARGTTRSLSGRTFADHHCFPIGARASAASS